MKNFNHKFNEKYNKNVDEIEREPAFLRNGIDVGRNSTISKTEPTLKKESDDLNFKSNNSFLHDNVD